MQKQKKVKDYPEGSVALYSVLYKTFASLWPEIKSVADISPGNSYLADVFKKFSPEKEVAKVYPSANLNKKYDIVVCIGGAHGLRPENLELFLGNLKKLLGCFVVTTEFVGLMQDNGFELVKEFTKKIGVHASQDPNFPPEWRESALSVWQRKS